MARVSRAVMEQNRERILSHAAEMLRERGVAALGVAEVMAAAGLTHGGFYGHFDSKDALVAEACSRAFAGSAERWAAVVEAAGSPVAARRALIRLYLTGAPTAEEAPCCPALTLAGDTAQERPDAPLHESYEAGLERLIALLTRCFYAPPAEARRQALVLMSTLVGARTLARATPGSALSGEILRAVQEALS